MTQRHRPTTATRTRMSGFDEPERQPLARADVRKFFQMGVIILPDGERNFFQIRKLANLHRISTVARPPQGRATALSGLTTGASPTVSLRAPKQLS